MVACKGPPVVACWKCLATIIPLFRSPSLVHPTPTKVLLTTTLRPVVGQLSGSLAQGVRLIDQCLHEEPTPQKMATFEWALNALLREVGRRIMA